MADIPTMYKNKNWNKTLRMEGIDIHDDQKQIKRPKNDRNFTCAMVWPLKGNDQQLGACNTDQNNQHCNFLVNQ